MLEGVVILLMVVVTNAAIFFIAGYLVGRSSECKEALDYIEHIYNMEGVKPLDIETVYKEAGLDDRPIFNRE